MPHTWIRGLDDARAAIDDLDPIFPDTFDDVVLAYDLGQLTDAEYEVLASAVAGPATADGAQQDPGKGAGP